MGVDLLRSAHRVHAEFGRERSHRAWVRWYKCVDGAKMLPVPTAFGSAVWQGSDGERDFSGPGMEDDWRGNWRPNTYPDALPGDHWHGPAEWFQFGIPESAFSAPPPAPDLECVIVAMQIWEVNGAEIVHKYEDVEILRLDRARRVGVEVADTETDLAGFSLGSTVGVDGGSTFDGVFTVLFSGATVESVDPTTVLVTVAAVGSPLTLTANTDTETPLTIFGHSLTQSAPLIIADNPFTGGSWRVLPDGSCFVSLPDGSGAYWCGGPGANTGLRGSQADAYSELVVQEATARLTRIQFGFTPGFVLDWGDFHPLGIAPYGPGSEQVNNRLFVDSSTGHLSWKDDAGVVHDLTPGVIGGGTF